MDLTALTGNSTLSVPPHVLSRMAADEAVVLNLESEEYYGLDGVGGRLWELVEEGITFGQAVSTLQGEYAVDRDRLTEDLRSVLGDLVDKGLVLINAP